MTSNGAMDAGMQNDVYMQEFSVSFRYPVHFGRKLLDPGNRVLIDALDRLKEGRRHRVQVFVDDGVLAAWPDLEARVSAYFERYREQAEWLGTLETVPGGERAKNTREAAEHAMERMARSRLCRQSFVLAIGGGSALDIIGLSASLVHRGVRLLRMPTTVLSQNDSGVGVKNGIDAYGVKNFAGTFAPPFAVLNDFDFLSTLPDAYWIGGVAEAFKVAIVRDADFFTFLRQHADRLRARCAASMEQVIRRCALQHLEHIRTGGDPFEFGTARPLDFGHWSAHWLEVQSGYALGHGQAVAVGIALDAYYAWRSGLLDRAELDAILSAMAATGLPLWHPLLERRGGDGHLDLFRGLEAFREHLGGRLNVTLPHHIGQRTEVHALDPMRVADGIRFLKTRAAGPS